MCVCVCVCVFVCVYVCALYISTRSRGYVPGVVPVALSFCWL